jgi:hypothetical protein
MMSDKTTAYSPALGVSSIPRGSGSGFRHQGGKMITLR